MAGLGKIALLRAASSGQGQKVPRSQGREDRGRTVKPSLWEPTHVSGTCHLVKFSESPTEVGGIIPSTTGEQVQRCRIPHSAKVTSPGSRPAPTLPLSRILCSVGSPPHVDTAIWRQPVAWPQGWQVAISPPKVWWLFLLLALTRPGLDAVLTSALESCAAQPDPGCPVAPWWWQLSMQAMQAVPDRGRECSQVAPANSTHAH